MLPTSSVELTKLRSLIEDKIQHAYLDKAIQKPEIDEIKLALLYYYMRQSKLPVPKIEQYILSTMFVQMALDIHEIVPLRNDRSESSTNQEKRQLKVLAGDYYSGLYYSLLSDTKDFSVIHILATAIKEINEYKMKLYYDDICSFDEVILLLVKIESLLVTRMISHTIEFPNIALIENIILVNRLLHEKKLFAGNNNSPLFDNLKVYVTNLQKLDFQNRVDQIISQRKNDIENSIADLPNKNDIITILRDILENDTSVAKEG
ncbi:heptaprenyl diphosphate synthase [Virgibacillus phasianinus]|uniref:Heptaprenyl diphosphate synthase n=1 Tax=Virgibacillus phasianinus TaxID=2017483 RepID=A0A220U604_9BACI|nr:heptaprenyl diphosphate synthase component 1 [Virgibacillus phasianinus]ASK63336.1 heptaprenyl diphosphate synthase [Virgibacillus phasianinus]